MSNTILLEINDNIAFITLNRPEKFNAFNREMSLQLQVTLDECATNKSLRAIYLTGSGKAFSSGQDLAEATTENGLSISQIIQEHYNPIINRIKNIELPVVCGINGIAAGAGANVALACDIVIATETASFIQAFTKIGLVPDSGGTFILPRLIGYQKASALMMLAEKITAKEATEIGMIYKYFADDVFKEEALKILKTLACMPTKAIVYTKKLLQLSAINNLETQLNCEDEFQQKAAATKDFKEGVNSFLEKRMPQFTGA
jgi:2-(1,2-epoxy-1,2-dihydrophenyl)acetyl-CoA isomerase